MLELSKNLVDRLKPHVNDESTFKDHIPTVDIFAFGQTSIFKQKVSWIVKGVHKEREIIKTGFKDCTYWQRGEMMSIIEGLKTVRIPSNIRLYSCCRTVNMAYETGLINEWKLNGWRKLGGDSAVRNRDLWAGIEGQLIHHNVVFLKASNEDNEKYSQLSMENLEKYSDEI